ncbi:MAG: glycine zipper 2TM domain-containing protein [Sphingosinicella sp.]|uniref:glycine zipper 2TM domain-containing protein n=1 Tax=Sphingosinicella sp. TaxID=1917971 RepID=UPI004037670C
MRTSLIALALASTVVVAVPAAAQTRADEARWEQAQERFEAERQIYERERARYEASRRRRGGGYGYRDRDRDYDDRYGWRSGDDWEPSRYYREDPRYDERPLSAQDEVYRGADGRYYCRRSDGTTGLVVGAGVGALLGRGIDTRGERTTGTVVGGVLGALIGREVERSRDMRCR